MTRFVLSSYSYRLLYLLFLLTTTLRYSKWDDQTNLQSLQWTKKTNPFTKKIVLTKHTIFLFICRFCGPFRSTWSPLPFCHSSLWWARLVRPSPSQATICLLSAPIEPFTSSTGSTVTTWRASMISLPSSRALSRQFSTATSFTFTSQEVSSNHYHALATINTLVSLLLVSWLRITSSSFLFAFI